MRMAPHPRAGEAAAALGVLTLAVLELVVLRVAPAGDRPGIGGALVGAAAVAFILVAVLRCHRRAAARHAAQRLTEALSEDEWFTARTLEGFPMEAVRPLLLGPDAPDLNRLHTAWVFATNGNDAVWMERNLDLPGDMARLLVDAARRQT
ncbi:hypothetical protein [Actinacidiphila oryziradicis]|jgi:hypothetical protein|uniref:hypothetical protein n=1 Tax=Actinacidiphila oryziradicis TaxID=2571141 RepID=UPI0023F1BD65|nr:hypothetical protein [Actinacidiphila oryziradicis]MCW2875021.1 uncharacterized protein [Actinacidiphila oryziradicis]